MIEQASLVLGNGNWAVKSDSLLGYKTIDGKYYPRDMTFTRATTGTRVNEAGLVEVVPYNLLQYSEQFDNASWGKASTTATANTAISPNGIMDADTYTAIGNSSVKQIFTNLLLSASTNYTLSIYAKKDTNDFIQFLSSSGTFGGGFYVNFDLQNGVIGQYNGALSAPKITDVGDGWYRCEASVVSVASPTVGAAMSISLITSATSPRAETNSLSTSVFLWGAQVVEGTEPLDYLPTTDRLDIARIDYSTGEPALLLEPQRTNLALQSSSFDSASWLKSGLTVTANQGVSPDGTQNADLLDDGTSVSTQHWIYQGLVFSNSTTYTISFYAKYVSRKNMAVNIYNGSTSQWVNYDIQNGVVVGSTGDVTASMTSVGNGWYRIVYTRTTAASGSPNFRIALADDTGNETYTGSNKQVYLWGAQLEAGSYATSYIPTTSASVTRNADQVSKTGISSLIGQTEGVIFLDIFASAKNADGLSFATWIIAGDAAENFQIYNSGTTLNWYARNTAGLIIDQSADQTIVEGTRYKIAFAYKSGDYALYINGVQKRTNANANVPVGVSQFNLSAGGYGASPAIVKNEYNAAALWKTRLTNDQLAQLTTL